jgi:DNA-binding LytR/AlgR family response regulator
MGDYVDIHSPDDTVMTKENISTFESILPENFIRIHRSFIVNQNFVKSFKSNELVVNDVKLPISRSYKNRTHKILTEDSIA